MKAPNEILDNFNRAVGLFARYRACRQRKDPADLERRDPPDLNYIVEADIRLSQALFFLRQFREHELKHAATDKAFNTTLSDSQRRIPLKTDGKF